MTYARRTARAVGAPLTLALAFGLVSCSSSSGSTASTGSSSATTAPGSTAAPGSTPGSAPGSLPPLSAGSTITAADKQAVVDTYAAGVAASYDAAVSGAEELQAALQAFTANPTQAGLDGVKQRWLAARDAYGVTEAFRFYDGPIDAPDTGPEGQINAWPMDEAYVDYVEGDAAAGVINDVATYPTITKDVLVEANEKGGETNISTGWHAIEFLLWGQDDDPDGPGNRPLTDYTTQANAARRITYLNLLADLLVEDLTTVRDAWAPGADNYRASFVKDADKALADLFRGIGALDKGELAGERMGVAYETKDQEDEHSCFSDNTANDVKNNALGIQDVWLATYPGGVTGPSPRDLVAKASPAVASKTTDELAKSVELTSSFPMTFEKMIQGEDAAPGRTALKAAITAIEQQGDSIAEAAKALGLHVNFEIS
jgi:putative iron-regulated protein